MAFKTDAAVPEKQFIFLSLALFLNQNICCTILILNGQVVQLVVMPTVDPGVMSWIPAWSNAFVEIDHEIISTVIFLLPLIQKGLLLVTSESMCTKYWLTAWSNLSINKYK